MAHISGFLYVTSGRLFLDNVDFGDIHASNDFGLVASPRPVGRSSEPYHRVYAGAADGTIYKFGPPVITELVPGVPLSDPAIFSVGEAMTGESAHADGVLYVGTGTDWTPPGQGSMFALDDDTGAVKWVRQMGGSVQFRASLAFQLGQPYRLIVGTIKAPSLQALDPQTGALIWSLHEYPLTGHTVIGETVYYADLNTNSLRARSVVDGSLVWESVNVAHDNFNRPFVAGNVVYATGFDSNVYAFDATGGEILWKVSSPIVFPGVPLLHNPSYEPKVVVFAAGQGSTGDVFMVGLDAKTGAHVWTSGSLNTGSGETVTDPIAYGWGGRGRRNTRRPTDFC
ncbi:PQQ-binding-like beta-propeller repeat protein [Paraburkholderia sp. BR10954]|uniref:outer membrane protein assembly factor BamB family protein n=1 Tax=Paraburkholderia sp. BR10954 TaxID=3236995 RepID=UPI0034D2E7CB